MFTKKSKQKNKLFEKKFVKLLLVKIGSQEVPVWLRNPMILLTVLQIPQIVYESQSFFESWGEKIKKIQEIGKSKWSSCDFLFRKLWRIISPFIKAKNAKKFAKSPSQGRLEHLTDKSVIDLRSQVQENCPRFWRFQSTFRSEIQSTFPSPSPNSNQDSRKMDLISIHVVCQEVAPTSLFIARSKKLTNKNESDLLRSGSNQLANQDPNFQDWAFLFWSIPWFNWLTHQSSAVSKISPKIR